MRDIRSDKLTLTWIRPRGGFFSNVLALPIKDSGDCLHSGDAVKFVQKIGSVLMFSPQSFLMRSCAMLCSAFCLVACGGSGSGPTASTVPGEQTPPAAGAVVLKAPVLSCNDTGLDVTDGVTSNGRWGVESQGIDWEFSLDQGITWTRGYGG